MQHMEQFYTCIKWQSVLLMQLINAPPRKKTNQKTEKDLENLTRFWMYQD